MPLLDRADSVLCVVDTQPGFVAHRFLTEQERDRAGATVERIAWLVGLAGLIDVPTVVVEEGADRNGATDQRVMERVPPGTVVHSKAAFSLTGSDAAVAALDATGRRTVVVVGFETDVCVMQSAVELLDRGFRAVAVEDATFSAGLQHERGIRRMTQAGVEINHGKGLVLEWLRTVDFGRQVWGLAVQRFGRFPAEAPAG
jgi:nicotinamidase-related amidase